MTGGGEDDDSVFEHVLTMDERGCRHTVCSAPVKHVFYTSKTGYVGVCRFHEDVYEEDIRQDVGGVRGREEIREKREELEERNGSVVYEGSMGSIPARCTGEIRALKWVLGEVDDL